MVSVRVEEIRWLSAVFYRMENVECEIIPPGPEEKRKILEDKERINAKYEPFPSRRVIFSAFSAKSMKLN